MGKGTISAILFGILLVGAVGYIVFARPSVSSAPTQEETEPTPLHDKVKVTSLQSGSTVTAAFTVKGEAPGNWYFEASFPIEVLDAAGNSLVQTHAEALSDWMTTEQVPFSADINIDTQYHGPATLVLRKDNPSGLPEHEDSLEIPIVIQ